MFHREVLYKQCHGWKLPRISISESKQLHEVVGDDKSRKGRRNHFTEPTLVEKWHVRPTPYRNWHTRNDSTATRLGDNTTKIYFVSIQQFLIQYHLTSIFRCYTFCFKFQLRPRKKCSLEYVQSYSSFQDWENVIQVTFLSLPCNGDLQNEIIFKANSDTQDSVDEQERTLPGA